MTKEDKINKVEEIIAESANSGVFPHPLSSVADIQCAADCIKRIKMYDSATFIQSAVKDFFIAHGLNVKEEGIGWRVAR